VSPFGGELEYSVERHYREVDLEVFYYNNTVDGGGNCDRLGPGYGSGPMAVTTTRWWGHHGGVGGAGQ